MDNNEILEHLENFIINYGNADVILSDIRSEHHYTDFTVADLIYAINSTNKGRIDLVLSICNREIYRQEVLMRCAEHSGKDADWVKHYELQGVYRTIKDIISGDLKEIEQ